MSHYLYGDGLDEIRHAFAESTEYLFERFHKFMQIRVVKVERGFVYIEVKRHYDEPIKHVQFLFFIDGILHYATEQRHDGKQMQLTLKIRERFLPVRNIRRMRIHSIALSENNKAFTDDNYFLFNEIGVKPVALLRDYLFNEGL